MKTIKAMARSRNIRAWILALVMALALGLAQAAGVQPAAAAPSAQATDPVSVVDAFHAAGDDIDAALALLTDDVVIELTPPPPGTPGKWSGKQGARAFFEWRNAGHQRRVREGAAQVTGNTVTGEVGVTSDTFKRLSLGTVRHTFQAEVVDGKLKYYHGALALSEQPRVTAAIAAAQQAQGQQPTGMPRTGGPLIVPFIFAIGMLILTVGAALRRRKV
jgi:hypothetical protein